MIILPILLIAILALQIFLSKQENKVLGLILPTINIVFSLIIVLGLVPFESQSNLELMIQSGLLLFTYNIPTLILLGIYYICRSKMKKNKGINKMNIQDLH